MFHHKSKDDHDKHKEKETSSDSQPDRVELKRAEYEKLCAEVKELAELKENLLRKAADFDNAKKRLAREKDEFLKFANERLMRDLLPVIDNLERVLEHANEEEGTNTHPIVTGVDLIRKQIFDYLKDHGLTKVEALGKHFDPSVHEAISQRESSEHPDETVLDVVQEGYLLHDRLLRPAKVIISKGPEDKQQADVQAPESKKPQQDQDKEKS